MIIALKKLNFLITKRQRKGFILLTFLLFVGMILEVFALSILIPALSIILNPETIEKTFLIGEIRIFFSEISDKSFIYLFLFGVVLLYLVKTLFGIFLTYKQNRFLTNITAYISNNLFTSYLKQSYSFHLKKNASELINNIQVEISHLSTFLISLITFFIEGGFAFSVLATLIYLEPFGAISVGVFYGFLTIIFLKFTKRKLNIWGKTRQKLDIEISKIALDGLGGIKDLLILGKAPFFINEFSIKNQAKAELNSKQGTISQIPRFYLEFISILGLVSFIILMLFQEKETESLITILGVFVAATFRMIPSLNRIIGATQSIKYYRHSVDIIHKEVSSLDNFEKTDEINDIIFKNEFELKKIDFSFKDQILVLENINLKIKKGQIVGIIGESGSGKSTLVDIIIGLHKPNSGEILIDGLVKTQLSQSWRSKIGYVPQNIFLIDDTIEKNIAFGTPENSIDRKKIANILKQVQLEKFISNLELGLKTKVGDRGVQVSGGQKQRIGIARALYYDPQFLILDEATSALDSETEKNVMNTILDIRSNKTIIIVAHRISTLFCCDKIYKIENKGVVKTDYSKLH